MDIEESDLKIKNVCFDLSGVVIKRQKPAQDLNDFLKEFGINISIKEYNEIFTNIFLKTKHKNKEDAIRKLIKEVQPNNNDKFEESVNDFLKYLESEFKIDEEIIKHIKNLKKNEYKIGLICNVDQFSFSALKEHGLFNEFDFLMPSFESGHIKPSKKIFEQYLEKSNNTAKETLYIGDSWKKDIIPAQDIGMWTILYDNNKRLKKELDIYTKND